MGDYYCCSMTVKHVLLTKLKHYRQVILQKATCTSLTNFSYPAIQRSYSYPLVCVQLLTTRKDLHYIVDGTAPLYDENVGRRMLVVHLPDRKIYKDLLKCKDAMSIPLIMPPFSWEEIQKLKEQYPNLTEAEVSKALVSALNARTNTQNNHGLLRCCGGSSSSVGFHATF
jgi:hypothetical protein